MMPAHRAVLIEIEKAKLSHDAAHTRSAMDAVLRQSPTLEAPDASDAYVEQVIVPRRRTPRRRAQLAT